ncbi:alpha/beta hydrolase-fold protein [Leadbetterella sp. DM7]|uniref:alpha/beta hydrolase-fold protein n=1 Tax=Leadbetterella sp. DM7 TaxID=3235085 RepID=UPI00349E768E
MRYYLAGALFFCIFLCHGQEGYSVLTRKALEAMWKAKDTTAYRNALNMYENAFRAYPDSVNGSALYKASVLAAELRDFEKAFQYLTPLSQMKSDDYGYPGWNYIVGKYSESEYKNLLDDPRWAALKQKAITGKAQFYRELKEKENEFYRISGRDLKRIPDPRTLYKEIRAYHPYQSKQLRDYSLSLPVNDSVRTSFLVHLPKNYSPQKKYPVLLFLHGAVRNNALTEFQTAEANLNGWNRYYTRYADQEEVILVFPKGSRQYNWMTPDDGFFMVPEIVKKIKQAIHVDDNKIFISGHSNGATGSFSYLMKQPTPFSGFYGFNTYPKVFTGGTFVENIKSRSFINFSTDEDYYYPPGANDDLTRLMTELKADYREYRYPGFPHWFPQFDESEPAYRVLFSDLANRERNPFPENISWEFDDEKYGNIDWLSDIKLDTLQPVEKWHKQLNFRISKWLEYNRNDSLITVPVDKNAFDFPRRSGKIKAGYARNVFSIETSCIRSFRINISPEMVNPKKKVKVYVNGKLYYRQKIKYNPEFMLQNFEDTRDREQVWVNFIALKV